jgi:hypothetical protein
MAGMGLELENKTAVAVDIARAGYMAAEQTFVLVVGWADNSLDDNDQPTKSGRQDSLWMPVGS